MVTFIPVNVIKQEMNKDEDAKTYKAVTRDLWKMVSRVWIKVIIRILILTLRSFTNSSKTSKLTSLIIMRTE